MYLTHNVGLYSSLAVIRVLYSEIHTYNQPQLSLVI